LPSKRIKDLLDELHQGVDEAVKKRRATLSSIGAESAACKDAMEELVESGIIPDRKEEKIGFYRHCLLKSLRGLGPNEMLREEEKAAEVCRSLAIRVVGPGEISKFMDYCRVGMRRGRTIEEIIDEYYDE
jgi:hypothetical protein